MNEIRRKILLFALVFLPAFVVCVVAYHHVQPPYQKLVVAAIDVGLHQLDPPMRLAISDDGGWTSYVLHADGTESFYWSRPGENLTLFYMSLAVLPALLLATPVGLRRRLRLLAIGMVVLYVLQVLSGFGLVVSIRCLANDPDALVCSWVKTVGNTFGQVSAFVIWVGLTWPTWFPGRETEVAAGPGADDDRRVPSRVRSFRMACLASLVLLGATYANHVGGELKLGDTERLVDNLSIRSLRNTAAFFADPQTLSTRTDDAGYRPLLVFSHATDHWLAGGVEARTARRTQLVLLVVLGAMITLASRRLYDQAAGGQATRGAALATAVLFCIHAANAATVNDLGSRSDLLGAIGLATSLWVYLAWGGARGRRWSLLTMVVGALAEPLTLLFAPLLVAYVWLFETSGSARERTSAARRRGMPAIGVAVGMAVVLRLMDGSTAPAVAGEGWGAVLGQPFAWLVSAWAFVIPSAAPLVGPTGPSPDLSVLGGVLFLAGLLFAVRRCALSRTMRPAAFGLVWFTLGSLAVSLRGTPAHEPLGNPSFIPYVGLTIAVVWSVARGLRRLEDAGVPAVRAGAIGLMLVVLAAHAMATHGRNELWRSDETLWAAMLERNPDDPRSLLNHGRALVAQGRHAEALDSLERAREELGESAVLERALAAAWSGSGQTDRADQALLRALELAPSDARAYGELGWRLVAAGRGPDAVERVSTAVELGPNAAGSRHLLMNLHAASGDDTALQAVAAGTLDLLSTDPIALAYTQGRAPIRADSETAEAYVGLGRRHVEARYWLDGAIALRQAVTLDPSSADALRYLAWARMQLGFHEGAIEAYRALLEITPGASSTWNDLGWAEAQLGRFGDAVASFERAVTLDPSNSRARANLAWARRQGAARSRDDVTD